MTHGHMNVKLIFIGASVCFTEGTDVRNQLEMHVHMRRYPFPLPRKFEGAGSYDTPEAWSSNC
jgi:hypothetical protein